MTPFVAAVVALAGPWVVVELALAAAMAAAKEQDAMNEPWAIVVWCWFDALLGPAGVALFALVSLGLYSLLVRP